WQGDTNAMILAAMAETKSPAAVLNVAGQEVLEVETLAKGLAARLGREPIFTGKPAEDALLSCPAKAASLLGWAEMTIEEMMDQVASWVKAGGESYGKPTRFEVRDGVF
ncbi:MAG: epimerase, partial [Verrucomicrobiota bacterium]